MSESQIAESVREAVDEATAGVRIPAGTAARARTRGRRRRAARGLLAVVPAVGLIAGVTVALHGGRSAPASTPSQASSVPGQSPAVQTDAYIIHHVEAALGNAGNYLIATSATSGPGQVTTTYSDPSTGTGRSVVTGSGDKATYWVQTHVSGGEDHWRTTYVDYTKHTWWTKTSHSGRLGQDTSGIIVLTADSTPGEISKALAIGEVGVGLKGEVDGHAAIELVYAGKLAKKAAAVHFWVDAKTYQPVEIVSPPFTSASTIKETWIRKSAANVAQTNKPQIPAGFRQIPPSPAFN
jgi:hypothetical protein